MARFAEGQFVRWCTDLRPIFATIVADYQKRFGPGPFEVLRVWKADAPAAAGHKQEVVIATPHGEAHLSGMWFAPLDPNTPVA
ncbi:MAG: hypothetical protein HY567_03885 [Candidatus Kerfeldbacteria bacterium]|nr:hypothetical protein [Candidatus Kerfeldbacteria bacterium]